MADVLTKLDSWSSTAASNLPANAAAVGPNTLADNQRTIQAAVRDAVGGDGTIASAGTTDLSTVNANYITVTGVTTITALGTMTAGIVKKLNFTGILTLTYNATSLIIPGAVNVTTAANDVAEVRSEGSGNWRVLNYTRGAGLPAGAGANADITSLSAILRSYLAGLTMSTAGASTTLSVAAGVATDTTNVYQMALAAIAKTTAAWAVGTAAGGLDTGSIANSTWYHFYVIKRLDTGVVDVVFSLSASAPTLPTNYTIYRLIGSAKTNGSAQWTKFIQDGDLFMLDTPVQDFSTGTPGSAAFSASLSSVPLGRRVQALLNLSIIDTASTDVAYVSDFSLADMAPNANTAPGNSVRSYVVNSAGVAPISVMTSTSQQIRVRVGTGAATCTIRGNTLGWIDSRGRNL